MLAVRPKKIVFGLLFGLNLGARWFGLVLVTILVRSWLSASDAAAGEDAASGADATPGGAQAGSTTPPPKRLFRIPQGGMIAGVCNGLAAFVGVDVTFIRVAFVVAALLIMLVPSANAGLIRQIAVALTLTLVASIFLAAPAAEPLRHHHLRRREHVDSESPSAHQHGPARRRGVSRAGRGCGDGHRRHAHPPGRRP